MLVSIDQQIFVTAKRYEQIRSFNQKGLHYHLNDTTGSLSPPCAGNTTIPPMEQLTWPEPFMQSYKFLGVNKVNQKNCNHFFARPVTIDGIAYQMDVWTSVANDYPCQIAMQDISEQITTTWAFDGFDKFIPPSSQLCYAAKIQCPQANWTCNVKKGASNSALSSALGWVCGNQDCSPIQPGGSHFQPNTLMDHCNWAFNEYFTTWKMQQGYGACSFNGVAELVPPANQTLSRPTRPFYKSSAGYFSVDLVCD